VPAHPAKGVVLTVAVGLAAAAILAATLPGYYLGLVIDGLIFAVFALGLNLLLGYTGLPSLGHAAYFGIGAYAAGLLSLHVTGNFWLGALAGVGASMLLGAAFGVLALRTSGVYFLMITMALAQIAWAVAFTWRSVTGGDDGLRGVKPPQLGLPGVDLSDRTAYFLLVAVALALATLLMHALIRSPFGRSLRGIQDSPVRMAALGYRVWLHKYLAFVLSSGFAGFAGVLFVYYKGFVSPESVSVVVSAEVMLMVILGGAGTLLGPILGALSIVLLSHVISGFTDRWILILGLLYAFVVLVAPQGIVGALDSLGARGRRAAP
jgi:branched-chain amino acid transport system permease protein